MHSEAAPDRRLSRTRSILRFLRRPTNAFAVVVLLLGISFAALPTALLPHDPVSGDLILRLQPPAWQEGGNGDYLLGTDTLGRDVLSRVMHGARYSLTIAFLAALLSAVIGITAGLIAGYYGGRIDAAIMRLADIQFAFPVVILSADANDRQIQRLLEAGATAYLTKPLDIHALLATVDERMPRHSPAKLN